MNSRRILVALVAAPLIFSQNTQSQITQAPVMETWPREVDSQGLHLVIYQPQVDSWKKDQLQARAAVTATRPPSTTEAFGIVTLTARTEVDKELRLVMLHDVKVTSANFPGAKPAEGNLEQAVRDSVATWSRTISLDRLLADLAVTGAETEAQANVALKSDPPRIIFSQVSSVLVLIDGMPVLKPAEGSTKYQRVINTPALMLFDPAAMRYYLDGGNLWMTATNLTSGSLDPSDQSARPIWPPIRSQVIAAEEKDPHDHSKDAHASAHRPARSRSSSSTTPGRADPNRRARRNTRPSRKPISLISPTPAAMFSATSKRSRSTC